MLWCFWGAFFVFERFGYTIMPDCMLTSSLCTVAETHQRLGNCELRARILQPNYWGAKRSICGILSINEDNGMGAKVEIVDWRAQTLILSANGHAIWEQFARSMIILTECRCLLFSKSLWSFRSSELILKPYVYLGS